MYDVLSKCSWCAFCLAFGLHEIPGFGGPLRHGNTCTCDVSLGIEQLIQKKCTPPECVILSYAGDLRQHILAIPSKELLGVRRHYFKEEHSEDRTGMLAAYVCGGVITIDPTPLSYRTLLIARVKDNMAYGSCANSTGVDIISGIDDMSDYDIVRRMLCSEKGDVTTNNMANCQDQAIRNAFNSIRPQTPTQYCTYEYNTDDNEKGAIAVLSENNEKHMAMVFAFDNGTLVYTCVIIVERARALERCGRMNEVLCRSLMASAIRYATN